METSKLTANMKQNMQNNVYANKNGLGSWREIVLFFPYFHAGFFK